VDIEDSISFGFSAEVEIFEKANLLFVQAVADFMVLDITNPISPESLKTYEGDTYLKIQGDLLLVQGFAGSLIIYRINFDNDEPTIENQSFNVNENESNGVVVGEVGANDADNDGLTYVILSGNEIGTFQIDQDTGAITVADEISLDFETNPIYTLSIEVSDGFESATAQVTINVLEIDLPPEIDDQIFSINENYRDSNVGEVQASDPENQTVTFFHNFREQCSCFRNK
jgi:hypothetical protein